MWLMSAGLRLVGGHSSVNRRLAKPLHIHSARRYDVDVCATCLWGEESAGRSPAGSAAPARTRSRPPGCSAGPVQAHTNKHSFMLTAAANAKHRRRRYESSASSIIHKINFFFLFSSQPNTRQADHTMCLCNHLCC